MYTKFYGFSEKPFNITPDPKFLFLTESHQEALSSLIYGIQERKGFISISGEVGTGKTTLIHHLLDNLDRKVKAVFLYQTHVTLDQLLKEVLLELELPVGDGDKSSLIRQLNDYLIQRLAWDENLAILIDEAQNLTKEVMEGLRMLSNLETSRSKLLQIVFVGQPELEAKLNSEDLRQLKQRIGIRRQIKPLTGEESRQYVAHRLKLVGSETPRVFTPEAVSLICQYARGIPRTINILCDNALLIGYGLSTKKIDAQIIHEVIRDLDGSVHGTQSTVQQQIVHSPQSTVHSKNNGLSNVDSGPSILDSTLSAVDRGPWTSSTVERGRSPFYNKVSITILALLCVALVILLGPKYLNDILHNPAEKPAIGKAVIARSTGEPSPAIRTGLASNSAPAPALEPEQAASKPTRPVSASLVPPASPKSEGRFTRIIAVEKGDNLYSLSQKYYNLANRTLLDHILESNREITNVHLIKFDQKIKIPEITEDSLIAQSSDGTWKVHLGTFLKRESARPYREEPTLKGKEIEVIPRQVSPQETWYRVVAGKFNNRDECLKVIDILKEKGLLAYFREWQYG